MDRVKLGWSIDEFCRKVGHPKAVMLLHQLMHGQCGISPNVALALERIGWSDAEFWMRRQAKYDLAQARRELEAEAVAGN